MSLFISVEGPDGSGKSTQVPLLAAALRERGLDVVVTREPGGTPLGEEIRRMLLGPSGLTPTPLAMTFLLSAARTQLVTDIIQPALGRGCIVIADRFVDSTLAYQCAGQGLDREAVGTINTVATSGLRPDCVLYVDVPAEAGMARVASRGAANRLDRQDLAFHQRVRATYLELAEREPDRWITIDGLGTVTQVHEAIMRAVVPRLRKPVAAP